MEKAKKYFEYPRQLKNQPLLPIEKLELIGNDGCSANPTRTRAA
jgi:hypothetical protein